MTETEIVVFVIAALVWSLVVDLGLSLLSLTESQRDQTFYAALSVGIVFLFVGVLVYG